MADPILLILTVSLATICLALPAAMYNAWRAMRRRQ